MVLIVNTIKWHSLFTQVTFQKFFNILINTNKFINIFQCTSPEHQYATGSPLFPHWLICRPFFFTMFFAETVFSSNYWSAARLCLPRLNSVNQLNTVTHARTKSLKYFTKCSYNIWFWFKSDLKTPKNHGT